MAPEQAAGDPNVDHRADVYAFGCLAYELLTGETPFHGRPMHQVLAAHFAELAPAVAAKRSDTPSGLADLIAQCLEKDPGQRPQSGTELVQRLEDVNTTPTTPIIVRRRGRGLGALIAGGLVLAVAAGAYALLGRAAGDGGGSARTLAVLPFANVGGDSAQEYFADGLTDELSTVLGKVPGVQITARSSAYKYKGRRDLDARSVGRALGAEYIVQGSVRREGDSIRVATQVTRSADNKEVWAESYNGDAPNVFALEDRMIKAVTAALDHRLGLRTASSAAVSPVPGKGGNQGTANNDAHAEYMRARVFVLTRRSVSEAATLFQKAIDKDSNFARAYAGLARDARVSALLQRRIRGRSSHSRRGVGESCPGARQHPGRSARRARHDALACVGVGRRRRGVSARTRPGSDRRVGAHPVREVPHLGGPAAGGADRAAHRATGRPGIGGRAGG